MIDYRYTNHNLSDCAIELSNGILARHGNSAFRVRNFSYRDDLLDELLNGGFLKHTGDGMMRHTGKPVIRVPGYVPPPTTKTVDQ